MNEASEFDGYVAQYDKDHRASIKLSGEEPGYFADYKIRTLRHLATSWHLSAPHILDFGAGIGASVPAFRTYFPDGTVTLADVSEASLRFARETHGERESQIIIRNGRIAVEAGSFDLAFTACVFHHIPHDEHNAWLSELRRVVRPGGRIVIFEHNPLNPLTLHAVRTCPFDVNAHLIKAAEMRRRVMAAGWQRAKIDFHVFFPAALSALRPLEQHLKWCPMGAQYACHAQAPE